MTNSEVKELAEYVKELRAGLRYDLCSNKYRVSYSLFKDITSNE